MSENGSCRLRNSRDGAGEDEGDKAILFCYGNLGGRHLSGIKCYSRVIEVNKC